MGEKRISIIVPVYKVEKYIRRCLESILNQTYHNLEILLIDDGSPDNSGGICDEYAGRDARVKVIHKKNGGVSSARNTGLKAATGDYIGFVDADDYILPEMYKNLVEMIKESDADIATCGFANETSPGKFVPYWLDKVRSTLSQHEQLVCLLQNKLYSCSCCDKLFKKEFVTGDFFDEKITHYEDLLFLYQVMKKSKKAVFTSEPYYYYCTNEGSAATSKFGDRQMSAIDVCEYIWNDVQENIPEINETVRKEFVRNNLMYAMRAARDGYSNSESIARMRNNVKKHLTFYLRSDAASGYKYFAVLLAFSWIIFGIVVKRKKAS